MEIGSFGLNPKNPEYLRDEQTSGSSQGESEGGRSGRKTEHGVQGASRGACHKVKQLNGQSRLRGTQEMRAIPQ